MDRRNLLRTAVAAPAVPLLAGAVPATAAPLPEDGRFAIAVLPDTQYLFDADSADPAPLRETLRYLVQERAAVFLTHLGDLTEHGTPDEMALASETFRVVDGKLPYSVLAGNHDVPVTSDDRRGTTAYLTEFGPHRFAGTSTFLGASSDGYNTFHLFEAAGRHFNRGQRAFFFALGYLGWFVSPWVLFVTTAAVVIVTWRRQFASNAWRAMGS